jgi:hypothetical protein
VEIGFPFEVSPRPENKSKEKREPLLRSNCFRSMGKFRKGVKRLLRPKEYALHEKVAATA